QSWVELGSIPSLDVSLLEPSTFLFTDSTSGWYSGPMEPNWEAGIAGRIGIWKSEDGGKTWEPDFILNSSTGPSESGRAALLALDETGRGWAVSPSTGLIFSRAMTGPGDANGNGIIDSGDYVVIANSLFKDPPDPSHDCNQDGSIDSGDLLCILRRLIK
ncbi:MAG: dockerin type I repeat-containing protein, partial [Acidobacteriota bacterium]